MKISLENLYVDLKLVWGILRIGMWGLKGSDTAGP